MTERYEDLFGDYGRLMGGTLHHSPLWSGFYEKTSGSLEERAIQVLEETGFVPTRRQFTAAQAAEPEPEPKTAKKSRASTKETDE